MANYAERVMQARQANVDLAEMVRAAGDSTWQRALVQEAYGSPRWEVPERAENAVRDFKNAAYLSCSRG